MAEGVAQVYIWFLWFLVPRTGDTSSKAQSASLFAVSAMPWTIFSSLFQVPIFEKPLVTDPPARDLQSMSDIQSQSEQPKTQSQANETCRA